MTDTDPRLDTPILLIDTLMVLGIFTTIEGFVMYVEMVLGIFTVNEGFTIKVEMVLGKKKLALNVLIFIELKLTGLIKKVETIPQISVQLFVEMLV